jgi:hypothetical protein
VKASNKGQFDDLRHTVKPKFRETGDVLHALLVAAVFSDRETLSIVVLKAFDIQCNTPIVKDL